MELISKEADGREAVASQKEKDEEEREKIDLFWPLNLNSWVDEQKK